MAAAAEKKVKKRPASQVKAPSDKPVATPGANSSARSGC